MVVINKKHEYYLKVKEMFEKEGCVCLEETYKPAKEPWKFLCVCGNTGEQRPSDFKRGRRCQSCGKEKLSRSSRLRESEVVKRFENLPETLLRVYFEKEEVKNKQGRTMVEYLCTSGHRVKQLLHVFGSGRRCPECARIRTRERNSLGIESITQELKLMGLEFLDTEYINMDLPFSYRCTCGNKSIGYLSALRKGIRCGCQVKKGEESHNWNHNLTQEERQTKRLYEEYKQWVKNVYERDEYMCQKCNSVGDQLHAHHIYSYSKYKDKRVDVNNGITLCKCCHIDFHREYGFSRFTPEDFYNYMEW